MRIGNYQLKLEKRVAISGLNAALISILAIVFALLLFSLLFIFADIDPLEAYKEIFSYAFVNQFGLPLSINRFIFLLLCTYAFIIPYRAGLWNIGMAGQLYVGSLCAYAVVYAFGGKDNPDAALLPYIVIPLMVIAAAAGGGVLGAVAGYLRGKFNVNEIVSTMMLNFISFWLVSDTIKEGGLFMNPGGRSESFSLPPSVNAPLIFGTPFTIVVALVAGLLIFWLFVKSKIGYQITAYGKNPAAARYAGVSTVWIPVLVFILGGLLAGLAGYHYFGAVPGVYKIARNYSNFGDLSFYGIICGLISQGNLLAAIPIALLFGGLSIGGRNLQGKFHMSFGVDYALLGVLMITLVAFQFFFRYKIVWVSTRREAQNG